MSVSSTTEPGWPETMEGSTASGCMVAGSTPVLGRFPLHQDEALGSSPTGLPQQWRSIPSRPLTSSWSTLQCRYSRSNLNWIQLEGSTSQYLPMSS